MKLIGANWKVNCCSCCLKILFKYFSAEFSGLDFSAIEQQQKKEKEKREARLQSKLAEEKKAKKDEKPKKKK